MQKHQHRRRHIICGYKHLTNACFSNSVLASLLGGEEQARSMRRYKKRHAERKKSMHPHVDDNMLFIMGKQHMLASKMHHRQLQVKQHDTKEQHDRKKETHESHTHARVYNQRHTQNKEADRHILHARSPNKTAKKGEHWVPADLSEKLEYLLPKQAWQQRSRQEK